MSDPTKILDISFSEELIKTLLAKVFREDPHIQHVMKQKIVGGTIIHMPEDYPEGNVVRLFFREIEPRLVIPVGEFKEVSGEPV